MAMWIVIGVVILVVLSVVGIFNSLVTLKNRVEEAWSDIDVQLKRRYDLIPNLIETVKGYAKHEAGVFQSVTEARANAMSVQNVAEQGKAENMLSDTLKSLFAVAENYPDLKANENFMQLQTELADTENKIMASRRFYNGNVRDFNIKIEVFPNNMLAGMMGFSHKDLFEIENEAEKENPKVAF